MVIRSALTDKQKGIRVGGLCLNNLCDVGDTILLSETETELAEFLMEVKQESEQAGLFLNIQKPNIMTTANLQELQVDEESVDSVE